MIDGNVERRNGTERWSSPFANSSQLCSWWREEEKKVEAEIRWRLKDPARSEL